MAVYKLFKKQGLETLGKESKGIANSQETRKREKGIK